MRSISIPLVALFFFKVACAQSFDCQRAQSPREHAICSDKELAARDGAVAAAFQSLRAQLSPESAALVQSDERAWLHWVDRVCPAHGKGIADDLKRCLATEYSNRERDLKLVVPFGNTIIFLRSQFAYKAGSANDEDVADNDPGFGYGTLRSPQIDIRPGSHDTSAYAALNSAVEKRASKLVVEPGETHASFPTAINASGTVDGYYTVEAVNGRFIDITLFNMSYGWGAAHPNTSHSSFLWWFDRNRELSIEDVFLSQSGWQDKLATLAVGNLRAMADPGIFGSDIDTAVHAAVSDPANWTLSRDGLIIRFNQYAIGPYAMGMPEIEIPWSGLTPILSPDFQPATLPARNRSRLPWSNKP